MKRRLTNILAALHVLAAAGLLHAALRSYQNGSLRYTTLFAGTAILLGCAVAAHAYLSDELRAADVRLEIRSRPVDPIPRALRDDIALGWNDLESTCCLRAWESHGAEHDPHHCTRKDQDA